MKTLFAIVSLLLIWPLICLAQSVNKIPVAVGHQGQDSEGKIIALKLKEAIRSSQRFVLVDDDSTRPRIALRMTSTKTTVDNRLVGNTVSYAIVYDSRNMPANGAFLTVSGLNCNRAELEFCASLIVASLEEWTDRLRLQWPELWKTL